MKNLQLGLLLVFATVAITSCEKGGVSNVNTCHVNGLQIAGIANVDTKSANSVITSGIANVVGGSTVNTGLQTAVILLVVKSVEL